MTAASSWMIGSVRGRRSRTCRSDAGVPRATAGGLRRAALDGGLGAACSTRSRDKRAMAPQSPTLPRGLATGVQLVVARDSEEGPQRGLASASNPPRGRSFPVMSGRASVRIVLDQPDDLAAVPSLDSTAWASGVRPPSSGCARRRNSSARAPSPPYASVTIAQTFSALVSCSTASAAALRKPRVM